MRTERVRTPWLTGSVLLAVVVVGCSKKPSAEATPTPATPAAKQGTPTPPSTEPPAGPSAPGAIRVNEAEPKDGEVTLKAPASVTAGETIAFTFTGPANARDYVDLVPRGFTATSGELTYVYVSDFAKGGKLTALSKPGEYDVRYVLDLKTSRVVKAVSALTITAATAQLDAPATATGAEPLSIQWTGPGNAGDYVDIVPAGFTETSGEISYAYTRDGNPAKVIAPGPAGEYLVRYVLEAPGGRTVLSTSPLKVTAAPATLEAPDRAKPGEKVVIEYTGPKRAGDYVDLVKKGYEATSGELTYFYVAGGDNQLEMPKAPGLYDLRYVMEAPKGRLVLVRRVISVK